uniref:C2H2-type domain-containing protein n=1 Tax=Cajanus cajan TaxID=3821 RepID=A0A151SAH1_CAJCA|nr:hypothetical protein KK1_026322 [Cajanus cajan]
MNTEAMEEHVSSNNDSANIAKGKRTKRRLRPLSPCLVATTTTVTTTAVAMMSSCSSASGDGGASLSSTTFEDDEEDMANCLILLAQGKGGDSRGKTLPDDVKKTEKGSTKSIDFYVYECKTCNRTFPSFQALGGHRARCGNNKGGSNFHGNKSKIHECSICGAEFTSGQALGGHMRRHRASNNNNTVHKTTSDDAVQVKPRNLLELDLNLPAPEEDLRDSKFQFPANQNSIMLSAAPALVGCHY